MCALSEDSLAWEILNEYRIGPEETLEQASDRIAREKLVSQSDVLAILKNYYPQHV